MDYETPDGSQFSLREVWRNVEPGNEDWPEFAYTSVSAMVDGKAYFGRLDERVDAVDEGEVLSSLEPVPPEAIYPEFSKDFMLAPAFDPEKHFLKAPSFTWDDCQPHTTFVADCMLHEVRVLERLKEGCHPNIINYLGCVVKDGRITHICLARCHSNIIDYLESTGDSADLSRLLADVKAGLEFLHSLGLAHNDINPENICVTNGDAVIIDFDSCSPFGRELAKGVSVAYTSRGRPVSAAQNDFERLEALSATLADFTRRTPPPSG